MRIGDNLSAISIGLSLSILCIKVYLDRLNLEVLADSNTQYHDTIPIVINESAILIFIQIIPLLLGVLGFLRNNKYNRIALTIGIVALMYLLISTWVIALAR